VSDHERGDHASNETICEALRDDHEFQRSLLSILFETRGDREG
jgi:hypothetical protein